MKDFAPSPGLANNTLRQIVHVSIGGSRVRLRLSNEYGANAVTLTKVHLATSAGGSAITASTDTALTFSGSASVTIPPKQVVTSDPVDFSLTPLSNVAISILFGSQSGAPTGHPGSRTNSYLQTGDVVSSATMKPAASAPHWWYIAGLDVEADSSTHALAILGDSLTDGRGSTTDGNDRWPDALAKRLQMNPATSKIGVLNLGIGANAVLADGSTGGPSALNRFDGDIIKQPGVKWVIVFEGVNDIRGGAAANNLTDAYKQFVMKAHAANLKIFGATITPLGENPLQHEQTRQQVNTFIKAPGNFDAAFDFAAAVQDPGDATKLLSEYAQLPAEVGTDGLHMNPKGYQKLAETIDLTLLQ